MDGLSSAASGIAVVSIAIQLANGLKKLQDFWSSVNEAPEDVQAMITDLQLLSILVAEIASEAQHVELDPTFTAVLQACNQKMVRLSNWTNDLEPGFSSARRRIRQWTAFKAAMKNEKIQRFLSALEGLKITLLLAQQHHYGRMNRTKSKANQQNLRANKQTLAGLALPQYPTAVVTPSGSSICVGRHIQDIEAEAICMRGTISDTMRCWGNKTYSAIAVQEIAKGLEEAQDPTHGSTLEPEAHSAYSGLDQPLRGRRSQAWIKSILDRQWSLIDTIFGTLSWEWTTCRLRSRIIVDQNLEDEEAEYEYKSSYRFIPAQWILELGFQHGYYMSSAMSFCQGWTNTIETLRPVPNEADIFRLCQQGDLEGVRTLFSQGFASVRDIDSHGLTALHIAVEWHHPKLCEFLIRAGADKDARDFSHEKRTPALHAAHMAQEADLASIIDTQRMLLDSVDFWDEHENGWLILRCLASRYYTRGAGSAFPAFMLWLIRSLTPDIQASASEAEKEPTVFYASHYVIHAMSALLEILSQSWLDSTRAHGITALYQSIESEDCDKASMLIKLGADPHFLCEQTMETPTSVALYTSWKFRVFRNALERANVDFNVVIKSGLRCTGPLVDAGWQVQTLSALFKYDFKLDMNYEGERDTARLHCNHCSGIVWNRNQVQPYWQQILEDIKDGMKPDDAFSKAWDTREERTSSVKGTYTVPRQEFLPEPTSDDTPSGDRFSSRLEVVQAVSTPPAAGTGCSHQAGGNMTCVPSWFYERDTIVCLHCWHYFKDSRSLPLLDETEPDERDPDISDVSSEDEFSPFHIHT